MAGRTQILVNGFVVAKDMRGSSLGGTTAVSGATVIGVTRHTITGTVNNDAGAIALTFSPALPNNTSVVAK